MRYGTSAPDERAEIVSLRSTVTGLMRKPPQEKIKRGKGVPDKAAFTGKRPVHFSYPVGDRTSAGQREFHVAMQAGFKTAVTTRPGALFPEHAAHLTALPRISLNGEYQQRRYAKVLTSGVATAVWNRFRRVDAA